MRTSFWPAPFLALVMLASLMAQPKVSPEHLYERVFAVVRMTGSGTWEDPLRPEFAPNPRTKRRDAAVQANDDGGDDRGIISFSYEVSDDGKYALVEFVATDLKFLKPLLDDTRPDVKVFRKGKATKEQIETEFRRHKSNFDWTKFRVEAGQ